MNKNFSIFKNPAQAIYYALAFLLAAGAINILSASYDKVVGWSFLLRYAFFAAISLLLLVLVRRVGYNKLTSPGALTVWCIVMLAGLLAVFACEPIKGAHRWIHLAGFSGQPSEFAKLLGIMLASRYLGNLLKNGQKISLISGPGGKVLLLMIFFSGIVYKQPDLGTAAIILVLVLGIFFLAGISKTQVALLLVLTIVVGGLTTISSPYRLARLLVFLYPESDPSGAGYQMLQSSLAVGSGGLIGMQWGQGLYKTYLPEAHTDFAFAVFCQENGFVGAVALMLFFLILGCALVRIATRAKDETGFLLTAGTALLIVGQALANMAMVCKLLPVIGVPLSFISYGGSSLTVSMLAIGLALSVYDAECRREFLESQQTDSNEEALLQRQKLQVLPRRR